VLIRGIRRPRYPKVTISPQPDFVTCGPTCLHAVYGYFGDEVPLKELIQDIKPLETGGTLAVSLACHALRRGYDATIYTYNLLIFDPSWFDPGTKVNLATKLRAQAKAKNDRKIQQSTRLYLEFLNRGGTMKYEDLRPSLIRRYLKQRTPILTGLSATYLYDSPREHEDGYDDIRGNPVGHFVVLSRYDKRKREVWVADPFYENPRFRQSYYKVPIDRLIAAILLGIVTYDANLLVLTPKKKGS
jgi:hypothetical protein